MTTTATRPKAQAKEKAATRPKVESHAKVESPEIETPAERESDGLLLGTFRTGMGVLEHTSLAVAEVPLKVLSTLGLPDGATGVAREGHTQMVHGIHGTLDLVVTQTAKLTGKGVSILSGAVGSQKS